MANTTDARIPSPPPPVYLLKLVRGSLSGHQVLLARGLFGLEDGVGVLGTKGCYGPGVESWEGSLQLMYAGNRSVVARGRDGIIRYFQEKLGDLAYETIDLFPRQDQVLLKDRIHTLLEWLDADLDKASISCAKAKARKDPRAYKQNVNKVFACLDRLEHLLSFQPMLAGSNLTIIDVLVWPMLLRIDPCFHSLGLDRKYLSNYPGLDTYMRTIYQLPGAAEASDISDIRRYYLESPHLNPGGFETVGPEIDLDLPLPNRPRPAGIPGFYTRTYPVEEEPGLSLQVQQVSAAGDCLFQSIAIGLAFARECKHVSMYDKSLRSESLFLRRLAVDTLKTDCDLFMQDDEVISTEELVACAASQFNISSQQYLKDMTRPATWGGGPEIVALVNALRRPIHVYEPICSEDGKTLTFQSCGKFGSPAFDDKRPVYILAADDRFPECAPSEVRRHGSGGNHFLALIPNWTKMIDPKIYDTLPSESRAGGENHIDSPSIPAGVPLRQGEGESSGRSSKGLGRKGGGNGLGASGDLNSDS
uniref:OTU domain-containing protein n=1 Tax=Amorphochlora amoebiformis TaxID=1561963 RepID=A0A7S0D8X8_9EUKA